MEEKGIKIHPIFDYLKEILKEKPRLDFVSVDGKIYFAIQSHLEPEIDIPLDRHHPWISVNVIICSEEIKRFRQSFNFSYETETLQLDGAITFASPLGRVLHTLGDENGSEFSAEQTTDNFWLKLQLDTMLQLIEEAKQYPYSKVPKKFQTQIISGSSGGR